MTASKMKRMGDLLLEAGVLTGEQVKYVLDLQRKSGRKFGEIVIKEGFATEEEIREILTKQVVSLRINLDEQYIDPDVPKLVTETLARRHNLIPYKIENGRLFVAMEEPINVIALDDVRISSGLEVQPVIAGRSEIASAIDRFFRTQTTQKAMEEFDKQFDGATAVNRELDAEMHLKVNTAPVVRFLDSLLQQAIASKASDIHIEPFEKKMRVRFRIDGELREVVAPQIESLSAIVTRVKIMGNMDIAERRLPQDGRVNYTVGGREVDMRVSIMPTAYGEKVVIRILDRGDFLLTKEQLGFDEHNLQAFSRLIGTPYGIVLVAGPTGSGKTTTLYAILQELNRIGANLITVEDPIEYRIDGVNQTQVNVKAGLTFASGLRSILRQDPDIIMIGEVRDTETAQIAVRAAITGHLVLSTIHTNDAASTVSRLIDMGIEPFLISSALICIVSQRLVKKVCPLCKVSYEANAAEKRLLKIPPHQDITLYKGEGCPACGGTGYKGRTAIVEVLGTSKGLKELITGAHNTEDIRNQALLEGMVPMKDNAIRLVLQGVTTVDELVRNTYVLEQE